MRHFYFGCSERKQSILDFLDLFPQFMQVFSDNNNFELIINQIKNKNIEVLKLFRDARYNEKLPSDALNRMC